MCFGCSYFHIIPAFLSTVSLCRCKQCCEEFCLGAWSCAFCTSEDLDVKYCFEPKLFLKKSCVHVDFIVFLCIAIFKAKINVLSAKCFCICSPWLVHQCLVLGDSGPLLFPLKARCLVSLSL